MSMSMSKRILKHPTPMDVLCDEPDWTGRFSRHPGNMHLQAMVRVQLEAYMACKSNDEEAEIVRLIILYVRRSGGRFLRNHCGKWFDGGVRAEVTKVINALIITAIEDQKNQQHVIAQKLEVPLSRTRSIEGDLVNKKSRASKRALEMVRRKWERAGLVRSALMATMQQPSNVNLASSLGSEPLAESTRLIPSHAGRQPNFVCAEATNVFQDGEPLPSLPMTMTDASGEHLRILMARNSQQKSDSTLPSRKHTHQLPNCVGAQGRNIFQKRESRCSLPRAMADTRAVPRRNTMTQNTQMKSDSTLATRNYIRQQPNVVDAQVGSLFQNGASKRSLPRTMTDASLEYLRNMRRQQDQRKSAECHLRARGQPLSPHSGPCGSPQQLNQNIVFADQKTPAMAGGGDKHPITTVDNVALASRQRCLEELERQHLRQQNSSLQAQVSSLALELEKSRRIDAEMRALVAGQKVVWMELQASMRNESSHSEKVQQPQAQVCTSSLQVIPPSGDENVPTTYDDALLSEYDTIDICVD